MTDIEIKSFEKPDETRNFKGKGRADVVMLGERVVSRGAFEPGWRWSNNIKPIVGTDSCQVLHLGYCLEGRMRIYMNDGTEWDIGPGDVVSIQPGHDAEVLGDTQCTFIDFGDVTEYAKPK